MGRGDHVDPGRGRRTPGLEEDHVFAPVGREAAQAVFEDPLARREGLGRGVGVWRRRGLQRGGEAARRVAALHLFAQRLRRVGEHDPRHALEKDLVLFREVLDAAQEDAAGLVDQARVGAGVDGADDAVVERGAVAREVFVDDDQVAGEPLEAPVGVRAEHIGHKIQAREVADAQQHDRDVPRDAEAPEALLVQFVRGDDFRRRPVARGGVDDGAGEAPVELSLGFAHVDEPQHDLAVGPRHVEGAVHEMPVVVLARQFESLLARGGRAGDEVKLNRRVVGDRERAADRHDGVEDAARGVGERTRFAGGLVEGLGAGRRAAAPEEAGAIRLEGEVAVVPEGDEGMEHPRLRLVLRAAAPGAEDGVLRLHDLGLHEQSAERLVRQVRRERRQHDFGVRGELDLAVAAGMVRQGYAADLHVVLRRDADLGLRLQIVVATPEFGAALGENGLLELRFALHRMVGDRPADVGVDVAQVAEGAPAIARGVLAPAGEHQVAPAAVAAADVGDHDVVVAVGEQVHLGDRNVRIGEDAHRGAGVLLGLLRAGGGLVDMRADGRRDLRDPLLQQHLGGAHGGVRHEAAHDRRVAEEVREREQPHALVVGHVGAHDGTVLAARHAGGRVVDRLDEAVAAERLLVADEAFKVLASRLGHERQGHERGVRRHDEILREAALEAQARHAEGPVLIGVMRVRGVVARFGDAPRHAALAGVLHLASDHRAGGLPEQRVRVFRHEQRRHEVFEHRAAPGEQRRFGSLAGQQPAQREPVVRRRLFARDEQEAGDAGFRRQQVVAAGILAPRRHVEADAQQLARGVVEEAEVHLRLRFVAAFGQRLEPMHEVRGLLGRRTRAVARGASQGGSESIAPDGVEVAEMVVALLLQRVRPFADRGVGLVSRLPHPRRRHGQLPEPLPDPRCVGGCADEQQLRLLQGLEHPGGRPAPRHLGDHGEGVLETRPQLRGQHGRLADFAQPGAQRHEAGGEIAAVHAGDVERLQRLERARVVPVVELAAVALELVHRVERLLRALRQRRRGDVAEVPGREVGEQREADVRRRRARGHDGIRILLVVVRRQPVVRLSREGVEEAPGPAGQRPQFAALRLAHVRFAAAARTADPPGAEGRGEPERQQRRGVDQRGGAGERDRRGGDERDERRRPHLHQEAAERAARVEARVARQMPDHQPAPRERQPQPRDGEGAQRDVRLVGQAGQAEQRLRDMSHQLGAPGLEMKAEAAFARFAQQQRRRAQQRREAQHRQREARPRRAGDGADGPARDQQPGEYRREEAPADVVEDLPLAQQREAHAAPIDARRARPQPREDLPVAAHPAVLAADVAEIGRGHVLVDLHAAQQRGTRVGALQQVVAEDEVFGEAPVEGLSEGVDVVDALADERALAEEILIDVRDLLRIRIESRLAAGEAGVEAAVGGAQAHAHPGLEDRVAFDDASLAGIEPRTVERVRERADHARRRAARQIRVRVQRDDEANRPRRRHGADDRRERRRRAAAQEGVELLQLAPLALVAHPAALHGVPHARAVQQMKVGCAVQARVSRVEPLDAGAGALQQRLVAR